MNAAEEMPGDDFFDGDDSIVDSMNCTRVFSRGDHVELANALLTDLGDRDDLVFDEGRPWKYDERGIWKEIDRGLESRIVQGYSGSPTLPKGKPLRVKLADVVGAIKLAHDQISRPGFFGEGTAIAFSDCVVRIGDNGLEVLPLAPEHRARAGYDFPYERRALPRRFATFLSDLFRDDDDRVEKELLLQEFFGACVLGIAPRYQRAIVGIGGGSNGKSTLLDVIQPCMPEGTTSAIAPQDLGQDYRRAMLIGKHLNTVSELPDRDIIAGEAFKAVVTGDAIVGRVIRESPVMFRPRAGHFFAANRLPGTSDQSEGFWRRFVVLTFNRSFTGDPTRDPDITSKLLGERPAIVSWFLEGAERLVREKAYTVPTSHHAALAEWRKNADQIALFVEDELRPLRPTESLATVGTSGATLYVVYQTWCSNNGHRPLASNRFAERMQALGLGATHTKHGRMYPVARRSLEWVKGGEGLVKGDPSPVTVRHD